MVWNLKKHRRSLPTTENRIKVIAEGDFLVIKPRKTKGLTLLEIIISVAIFALVAAAVSLIFNRSLFVWRATTDKNAAAQEAQTATEWLLRDIQLAKYIVHPSEADKITLVNPEDHEITYYLDSTVPTNEKIRRQQDGVPVPGYLVAKGVMLFSLKYYDIDNNELVPGPDGLSDSQLSLIKAVEIDITTQKNTREFRLNTVARADYYPYHYWIKQYTFGDTIMHDDGVVIQQTRPDRGYIFGGTTEHNDILMIKINSLGFIQWAKTYDSGSGDKFGFVQQTLDEGYIIGGSSGNNSLLIKTDEQGNLTYPPDHPDYPDEPIPGTWAKTYPRTGASSPDYLYTLQQTDDGYILGGVANHAHNNDDGFLIKVDSNGEATWAKIYDLWDDEDQLYSVQQTSDGYILAGTAEEESVGYGSTVGLVIKTDRYGNIEDPDPPATVTWAKTYGGLGGVGTGLRAIREISGGYILGGTTNMSFYDGLGFLLVETNIQGNAGPDYSGTWAKRYSWRPEMSSTYPHVEHFLYSLDQTEDGGYILGGFQSRRNVPDAKDRIFVVKTEDEGIKEWARGYDIDIDDEELFCSLQQNIRKGYIFAGYTQTASEDDGDPQDEYDFLVAKTDDSGDVPPLECCPNIIEDITESDDFLQVDETSDIVINDVQSEIDISEYDGIAPDDFTLTTQDIFSTITTNVVSPTDVLLCPRCPSD